MANNTTLNAGTGGDTLATEDIAGIKYQRVKLIDPTAASTTPIGTSANPIRTDPTGSTTQPVSGTVTATGPLTDTQLRATPVPVSGTVTVTTGTAASDLGKAEDAAHTSGDVGVFILGVRNDNNTTYGADNDYTPIAVSASGAIKMGGQVAHDGVAAGNPVLIGGFASAAAPAGVSADADIVRSWYLRNGAAATVITAAGALIGGDAANGLDVDVTRLPSLPAGTNMIGDVALVPQTTGGLTMSHTVSAASTNATSLKASAGQVYAIQAFNLNAAARYLKLYNKASAPTVGSDTPVKVLMIPGGSTAGAGVVVGDWSAGLAFGTGIAWALTTGLTDADTGAVAASEILVEIDYA
jgi:hypothetical protein